MKKKFFLFLGRKLGSAIPNFQQSWCFHIKLFFFNTEAYPSGALKDRTWKDKARLSRHFKDKHPSLFPGLSVTKKIVFTTLTLVDNVTKLL